MIQEASYPYLFLPDEDFGSEDDELGADDGKADSDYESSQKSKKGKKAKPEKNKRAASKSRKRPAGKTKEGLLAFTGRAAVLCRWWVTEADLLSQKCNCRMESQSALGGKGPLKLI